MNYLWVLKMKKKQLINKCAELNECVNTRFVARALPRPTRALASRFGSRGERRGELTTYSPRHATRGNV